MAATKEGVLAAVIEIASTVSGVPPGAILATDTLKTALGMGRADLVRFADKVTDYVHDQGGTGDIAFEVVDGKNQTVGGVATETFRSLSE